MAPESSTYSSLLQIVQRFAPASRAPTLLRLAATILNVDVTAMRHREEILGLCRALAGEGGLVQEMAAEIADELAA